MSAQGDASVTLSGRRFSASSEASRAAELERIRVMSAYERMSLALALGRRRPALERRKREVVRGDV